MRYEVNEDKMIRGRKGEERKTPSNFEGVPEGRGSLYID